MCHSSLTEIFYLFLQNMVIFLIYSLIVDTVDGCPRSELNPDIDLNLFLLLVTD